MVLYNEENDQKNIFPLCYKNKPFYLQKDLIPLLYQNYINLNINLSSFNSIFISSLEIFNQSNLNSEFNFSIINDKNLLEEKNFMNNEYNSLNLEYYLIFNKPIFISFFLDNALDVPVFFKKSKSLKFLNFNLPILKFCNYLMKKGQKEKIIKKFINSFRKVNLVKFDELIFFNKINWIFFFFLNNNNFFFKNLNNFTFFSFLDLVELEEKKENTENSILNLNNNNEINKNFKNDLYFKNKLLIFLNKIKPIFSYFIYNIDKNIKKFSRGKSGKYIFIWKYIAPYKRQYISMKWMIKELKFDSNIHFWKKIINLFNLINKNIYNSFSWKSKNFSHNFVFKNYKKTLMQTLLTIS